MVNDPCAPLRARLQAIQEELNKRQQQPPQGGGILTPGDVSTDLATMSDQQLMAELEQTQVQLQQCQTEHS